MDATLSSKAPRPEDKVDPATQTAKPSQRRRCSHVRPETEATPLRRRQAQTGGGENGMENCHRGFVASKHEPKTRERENAPSITETKRVRINTEANVEPSCRAPRPEIDPATQTATSSQRRRFSPVPSETGATLSNHHREFVAPKHEPRTREGGDAPITESKRVRHCPGLGRDGAETPPLRQLCRLHCWINFRARLSTRRHPVRFCVDLGSIASIREGDSNVDVADCSGRKASGEPLQPNHGTKSRGGSCSTPQAAGQDDMEVEARTQTARARVKRKLEDEIGCPPRRVKREHPMGDYSSSDEGFCDCLAPPRGSVGGRARNRAAKNTSGKNKRRRSAAAAEEKFASRRRFDQAREVHCCKADPVDMVDMWVWAPSFDQESGEAVPGVFHYLPVTLIQQSSKRERGGKVNWYVQPGGQDMRQEWHEEGRRVVWKVPAESLFPKAPAESGKGCKICGQKEGQVSWIPDKDEHICDSCADAPRRNLQWHYDARDLGFERARACGCGDW